MGAALGIVLGVAGYLAAPVRYESTATVRVAPTGSAVLYETTDTGVVPRYEGRVRTQAALVKTAVDQALRDPELAKLPIAQGWGASERIIASLTTREVRGTELFTVVYEADDPDTAQTVVNALLRWVEKAYGDEQSEGRWKRYQQVRDHRDKRERDLEKARREQQDRVSRSEYAAIDLSQLLTVKAMRIEDLKHRLNDLELALTRIDNGGLDGETNDGMGMLEPRPGDLERLDPELATLHRECERQQIEVDSLAEMYHGEHAAYSLAKRSLERLKKLIAGREAAAREKWFALGGDLAGGAGELSREHLVNERRRLQELIHAEKQDFGRLTAEQIENNRIANELTRIEADLEDVNRRLEILKIESNPDLLAGRMEVEQWGNRPFAPSKDRRSVAAAAGFVGGLGLVIGVFFLLGIVRRPAYSAHQLRRSGGRYRFLGVLPQLSSRIDLESSDIAAQCVHQIRNQIESVHAPGSGFVLVVSSPYQGDGKTSTAIALAWSYASSSSKTLLVDCDLVGQSLTRQLNMTGRAGLKESLRSGRINGEVVPLPVQNLSVLPVGVEATFGSEALRKRDLDALFDSLRKDFDVIIVDTGPMPGSLEALPAAAAGDGVLLLVRRGRPRTRLEQCVDTLHSVHATCVGVVLNCAARVDCETYTSQSVPFAVVTDGEGGATQAGDTDQGLGNGPESSALVRAMEMRRSGAEGKHDDSDC